ncbi:hypothetical protein TrLO_g6850 [Triparma laevis f. longispina]|uniref:Uncharacterized protein n=1 Tax=Triparma laevis f. longispina TaxID=1714387 RepID=A0A9W7KRW4_9STRA|nr:hypothetical protein TrLO_g6850 [Triparma laevis f. longispina]
MGNTCFPSFLNTAYERKCGKAFEGFNKEMMTVPTDVYEFAIGIGSSRKDEKGLLTYDLEFRFPHGG